MCGIAGILNFDQRPVDRADLQQMNDFMVSRGPDNEGYYVFNNIGLAHRRLSIIDLSSAGHQPMLSMEERLFITFNGEIYNFPTLRKELESLGAMFRSNSDTEVLLEGYRHWGGEKLLQKTEGMFAFVLIDTYKNKALLARDRFGQKPLYFYRDANRLVFSSDIRSVASQCDQLSLNYGALEHYLEELAVPQPASIYNEIKQLRPGGMMEVDLKSGQGEEQTWWRYTFGGQVQIDEEEALAETEKKLIEAIKARTIADVPIACFLSGGVDSGLIVSLLAQHSAEQVNTFSVGFAEEDFNELPYAKALAERYGTNHRELIISPDINQLIPQVYGELGEPFADSSILPTYLVSREMVQHYKVALSGDGGDELFGYPAYVWYHQVDRFMQQYPDARSRKLAVMKSKVMSRLGGKNLGALAHSLAEENNGRALMREMAFSSNDLSKLLVKSPEGYTKKYLDAAWKNAGADTFADNVFGGSVASRLLNDYLVKVDRASMLTSLEVRSPFLDARLAAYAFRLPNDVKFKGDSAKYLLKKLAEKYIAPDITTRKKSGFSIPVGQWMKKELKPLVTDMLSNDRIAKAGIFNPAKVQQLLTAHLDGSADHTHRIWSLLCFELWREKSKL